MPQEYQKPGAVHVWPRAAAFHVSASGISRPAVQRKPMHEIVVEQRKLEEQRNFNGNYTTVGLEWNIVTLDQDSYPFRGMSHIELAQSPDKVTGVRHKLETESSNRLEYVAPPFFVKNSAPGSTEPDYDKLKELIDAQQEGLRQVVDGKETMGDLLGIWKPFLTTMTPIPAIEKNISSRNWSSNSIRTEKDLKEGIGDGSIDWTKTKIQDVLLNPKEDYQINVATDAITYEETSENTQSRLGKDEDYLSSIELIFNSLENSFPNDCSDGERAQLRLFNMQLARVLRQQTVVPYLKELRQRQELLANDLTVLQDNKFVSRLDAIAKTTSFIKDRTSVWLKTDLLSYGLNLFTSDRLWAMEKEILEKTPTWLISVIENIKGFKSEDMQYKAILFINTVWTEINDMLELGKQITFERIDNRKTDLFDHNPLTLGVRQDTFLPGKEMRALQQELQIGKGGLSVMELRNAQNYLTYLKKKQKKQTGWSPWSLLGY
ncbi:hypothetical protein [Chitinophaga filiformis]|uniref:Uncharacterized protein n=1 Tax=Chitinophaga filiformis TaxID=104663 RepID=A0A1G7LH38_CHIFI|nr:hypothetical protein [Chitinophaga filiformis]SDF48872.1 hypothetical protein SAMN04488121_10266 [Chitinophaga filiformis]